MADPNETLDEVVEAKITTERMTYSYGRKVSDGNYGSHDLFVSETVRVHETATPEEREQGWDEMVARVDQKFDAQFRKPRNS